jgi:hypothetical protein
VEEYTMHTIGRATRRIGLLAALAAGTLAVAAVPAAADSGRNLLNADLTPTTPAFPPVAGVTAGGRPWAITEGEVRVRRDGSIRVEVEGLVIPVAPFNGTNPVASLAASLVCGGSVVSTTGTVPFSPAGDATIRSTVAVPPTCADPIVLLNPGGNAAVYIAVTSADD